MKRRLVSAVMALALMACTNTSERDSNARDLVDATYTAPVSVTSPDEPGTVGGTFPAESEDGEFDESPGREDRPSVVESSPETSTPAASGSASDAGVAEASGCDYPPSDWSSDADPIGGHEVHTAPPLPFEGLVQLWPGGDWRPHWFVRYLSVGLDANGCLSLSEAGQVPLPDEWPDEWAIDCIGKIAMAVHPGEGVEVGGAAGVSDGSYLLPWGGEPVWRAQPSEALAEEMRRRESNVSVGGAGDVLVLEADGQAESYEMRSPPWPQSPGWDVRARHDGPLVLVTAQPAHLECFSGVSWLSEAATGRVLACGGNTMATAYVSGGTAYAEELVLPRSREFDDYIECGLRLDLWQLAKSLRR